MITLRQLSAFTLLACASLSAQAHRTFLVPTSTVVSGNAPWVSFDAAAATNVFEFDHVALKLDNLQITAPDGSKLTPENSYSGRFRSSFDVQLKQTGTYKIGTFSDGLFASYKENGQPKRWRGSAEAFAKEIPAGVTDLQVTQRSGRVETIVTNGKPGGKALEISGKGLELSAVTHPNDLVFGENATFRLLLDGKPAANVSVEVIPGGARYRQKLNDKTYVTDANGQFSVSWTQPGLQWLEAEVKDDKATVAPAKSRVSSYVVTLEVLPQ
ncbi:DUF4198 domain-containing protein [Undibacterium rugosum]|uniref:DUF4198 domain-containing protein n=1 Tax=Undibacterium rugosum TaxID=2762291 RepID=A0A923I1P5_9BURK|nr:DUF4198 domain-containing protein [Undibacterium rugosum]MBC3933761.1 DUF4198 domain-containing protein [Undibacterium rugosum]MBR7777464.1 DUF4198 domain-containing protein [Undibacterium rugosum]